MELKDLKAKLQSRLTWIEEHQKMLPEIAQKIKRQLSLVAEAEVIEETLVRALPVVGPWVGQKEAVLRILQDTDRPLIVREITREMIRLGYHFRSKKPRNSMYVLLNRMEKAGKLKKQRLERKLHFSLRNDRE